MRWVSVVVLGRLWFWMCGGVHGEKESGGAIGLVVFEQLVGVVVVHDGKERRKRRMVEFFGRTQERGNRCLGWWRREERRENRGRTGNISCFWWVWARERGEGIPAAACRYRRYGCGEKVRGREGRDSCCQGERGNEIRTAEIDLGDG
ncbi:hypothetical protein HAX54_039284 [Datura stramonium]|uniref:Secreted protein n=1 Tax=Datura stramonium TaxID=4076 RepID=A0ABS8SJ68_DATST|nr:hypothetical protein [Datura stramonium]